MKPGTFPEFEASDCDVRDSWGVDCLSLPQANQLLREWIKTAPLVYGNMEFYIWSDEKWEPEYSSTTHSARLIAVEELK